MLLSALRERGASLAEAAAVMTRMPQRLVSIRVQRKGDLGDATDVWDLVRAHETRLGDDGRIVLRASGTEPLVRVMVEAADEAACERHAAALVTVVETELALD